FKETSELRHYRLDRMRDIEVTEELFEKDASFELQSYVDNSFQMFSGEDAEIVVRFHIGLLNPMYDRFGLNVGIEQDGEHHFILRTKAKISEGLLGWILQWGTKAEVLEPSSLVESVSKEIEKMTSIYKL